MWWGGIWVSLFVVHTHLMRVYCWCACLPHLLAFVFMFVYRVVLQQFKQQRWGIIWIFQVGFSAGMLGNSSKSPSPPDPKGQRQAPRLLTPGLLMPPEVFFDRLLLPGPVFHWGHRLSQLISCRIHCSIDSQKIIFYLLLLLTYFNNTWLIFTHDKTRWFECETKHVNIFCHITLLVPERYLYQSIATRDKYPAAVSWK